MLLSKAFLIATVPMVMATNRIVIDKKSCSDGAYDKMKFWLIAALARAKLTADSLGPYFQHNTPPNQSIMDELDLLFGSNDVGVAGQLFGKYDAIRQYKFHDVDDVWSDAWKGERDQFDVQIHCNADHIIDDRGHVEPNINWKNTVQNMPVYDGQAILDLKDPKTPTQAVTSPAKPWKDGERWQEHSPEVITFEPGYIKDVVKGNIMFNSDLIKKAIHPSLLDRIKRRIRRDSVTAADLLMTPDLVLLHELTHLIVPGYADDSEGDDSYGWENCVRLKKTDNADNLAFFGLGVDLILNHKYRIDEAGKLHKI